jgi:phosphopantothenoylcysteine decarboxylase/phosphopantothenate--cysteine ligase
VSHVLLAAGGSVAVYKACDLASKLAQRGHGVRTVLTGRAAELVNPQLFEAVTGEPAYVDEYDETRRGAMDHIDLSTWADVLVVAPCSANLLARLALGLADDLPTTAALALPADVPRLVCPAMNPHMLATPAVQRHLGTLREDGWGVFEPDEGHMACGVNGRGRLPDTVEIADRVEELLAR